jgi:class 3 adenylate cyclase
MPAAPLDYRWVLELQASPAELWPLIADTNQFNRDSGLPRLVQSVAPPASGAGSPRSSGTSGGVGEAGPARESTAPTGQDGESGRVLAARIAGWLITWEEEPFEWVRPRNFGVHRRYRNGPLLEMRVRVELEPLARGGTRLEYRVTVTPRHRLGRWLASIQIGRTAARRMKAVIQAYDRRMAGAATRPALELTPARRVRDLAPGGNARLADASARIAGEGVSAEVIKRLGELLRHGDDDELGRMRPYALADQWGLARRATLEAFLHATRAGLLDFRWDLVCPLCRGATSAGASLSGIPHEGHCESCQITCPVNFDRLVELTFRPNPAIRVVETADYCIGGPPMTPHIVVQQVVEPGEGRVVTVSLEPGSYRVRVLRKDGGQPFRVGVSGQDSAEYHATSSPWPAEQPVLSQLATLRLQNSLASQAVFIIERTAWSDQAVTAAEVLAMQAFRDLFAQEALRPGEQVSVGSQAVVFTDLKESTRLYRQVGDAAAFGRVLDHFDILRQAVDREGGAIVKTIGDAVMAVFRRPVSALRAMTAAHEAMARSTARDADGRPLVLKVGIHHGPCIAVTLNDRLDYFGTTVNMAARLQGLAQGGEIVLSETVIDDPEVALWLGRWPTARVETFQATLHGFDQQRFSVHRLTPAVIASR